MAVLPIIPSLSRAPDFATTRKIIDGSVTDDKESGYVTSRPRFTRLRRAFGVTWKNLIAEDVRALDLFETQTVVGGAGSFWLPNLVPNGSFELPQALPGELLAGWSPMESAAWSIGPTTDAADGTTALLFTSMSAGDAELVSSRVVAVTAGDVLTSSAMVKCSGTSGAVSLRLDVNYSDSSTQTIYSPLSAGTLPAFTQTSSTLTIPAAANATAVWASVMLSASGSGSGTTVTLDSLGLALTTAAQPFGRMPGSSPIGRAVRFTKALEIKDAKPADGVKRYDVTCEVTEV